jgi:hypothetical protein
MAVPYSGSLQTHFANIRFEVLTNNRQASIFKTFIAFRRYNGQKSTS